MKRQSLQLQVSLLPVCQKITIKFLLSCFKTDLLESFKQLFSHLIWIVFRLIAILNSLLLRLSYDFDFNFTWNSLSFELSTGLNQLLYYFRSVTTQVIPLESIEWRHDRMLKTSNSDSLNEYKCIFIASSLRHT